MLINVPFRSPYFRPMSPLRPPILLNVIKKKRRKPSLFFTFLLVFSTKLSDVVRSYTKINHLGAKGFIVFHFYGLCMILFS
jgi:hypothetical protein